MSSALAMGLKVHSALIRARQAKGLTQAEVADRLGMDRAGFCRLENGHTEPSAKRLFAWAAVVGVSITAHQEVAA